MSQQQERKKSAESAPIRIIASSQMMANLMMTRAKSRSVCSTSLFSLLFMIEDKIE